MGESQKSEEVRDMETLFGHADWGGGKGGGGSSSSKKSVPDEQSESASETFAGERALMLDRSRFGGHW